MKKINVCAFRGIPLSRNQMRDILGGQVDPEHPAVDNYSKCIPECQAEADAAGGASSGSGIPGIWAMTYASCMSACLTAAQTLP